MGLNWHKGAEGASRGLETILGVNQKSIDIQYDEIVRENQQRFRREEREATQAFRSDEAGIERDWRSAEAGTERDWKSTESAADRDIQREQFDVSRERIEEDRKYRQAVLADREANTAIKASKSGGEGNEKATIERLEALRKERDGITKKWVLTEEDEVRLGQIDNDYAIAERYGAYGELAYNRVIKAMEGYAVPAEKRDKYQSDIKFYAGLYASLGSKDRKAIDRAKVEYERQKIPAGAAYMRALDEYMQKGGTTPDVSGEPDTQLEKSTKDVELEKSVGNVDSTPEEQEVEGGTMGTGEDFLKPVEVTGKKRDQFVGPPEPEKPARERGKPDFTVPAYEKTKPVREKGKAIQTKAKAKRSEQLKRKMDSWLETGEMTAAAAKLLKRMHSRTELKKILSEAGYSSNMVDKFLEYIYALKS
jgi:hypothetical protein